MFHTIETIGEGTYGIVYKARHHRSGKLVALKKMRINIETEGVPSTAIREITLLKELDHPNIVKLLDVVTTDEKLFLVFEYLNFDLKRYMSTLQSHTMTHHQVQSYMYQLCRGMSYCHAHRILHRDLKPQNLLLDVEGSLKVADFGLSRSYTIPCRPYTNEVVTMWYRAPELLLGTRDYSPSIDSWSMGCLFYEMVKNVTLFAGDSDIDQIYRIFRTLGTPENSILQRLDPQNSYKKFPQWSRGDMNQVLNMDHKFTPEGLCLLLKFLEIEPFRRCSPKKSLSDDYFKGWRKVKPRL